MTLDLSIVAPVFNEGPIVAELADRCVKAATESGVSFEVLLVDDCSTDDTKRIAGELQTPGLRFIHLAENRGQFGATQAGLGVAVGDQVVVLDGDLQDPPEAIGALVERMAASDHDVVFAVKESRADARWMKVAAGVYGVLQGLSRHRWPRGAGSYCIMRSDLARSIARLSSANVNLAAVVMALGARVTTLPYHRAERWDVGSHVGAAGLVAEALVSLAMTGALARLLVGMAAVIAVVGAWVGQPAWAWATPSTMLAVAALLLTLRVRRMVASVQADGGAG